MFACRHATHTPRLDQHQVGSRMLGEPLVWLRSTLAMCFLPLCVGRGFGVEIEAAIRHEWSGLTDYGSRDFKETSACVLCRYTVCFTAAKLRNLCRVQLYRGLAPQVNVRLRAARDSKALWRCSIQKVLEIADYESFYASSPRVAMDHGACRLHNFVYLITYQEGRNCQARIDRVDCSKISGQLPCARHSGHGFYERIPPYCQRCCMMSQGVRCIRRVVTFTNHSSEMWIRNGNGWTRLRYACSARSTGDRLHCGLQMADQDCKRLGNDRVFIWCLLHPTTDRRSETITSVSSRNVWCGQGWYG